MKADTEELFGRAGQAIHAAEILLDGDEVAFAVGRAYYAMLYTAEAVLIERGYRFKTHGSVHGLFGQHFAKTGLLDAKFHRWLIDAFDERLTGDYAIRPNIAREDVVATIARACEFLEAARRFLGVPEQ